MKRHPRIPDAFNKSCVILIDNYFFFSWLPFQELMEAKPVMHHPHILQRWPWHQWFRLTEKPVQIHRDCTPLKPSRGVENLQAVIVVRQLA